MSLTTPVHPKCGKTYPGGDGHGHCGSCCETFAGQGAFDAHRVGEHGEDRRCEITDKHWLDDRGFWHHGKRLTKEEREEIWGSKS